MQTVRHDLTDNLNGRNARLNERLQDFLIHTIARCHITKNLIPNILS